MNGVKLVLLLLCTFFPSWARLAVWRMLGFKVGRACHVSILSVVVADRIELAAGAVIESLTLIYRPGVFSMGERARIAGLNRLIGYHGKLSLGAQSFVGLGCLIDVTGDVELGERSQIGPRSTLYSHGATGLIYNMRYPHRIGPIRIGADTWLGMGCIVHPQLTIGDRVIVLPGLVIRGDVPSDTSLIPAQIEHRTVPTRRLLIGVTDEVRQAKMEGLFWECAHRLGYSRLNNSNDNIWRVTFPREKTIHLRRNGVRETASPAIGAVTDSTAVGAVTTDSMAIDSSKLDPSSSVIWTLHEDGVVAGVPSFCFDRLTVVGPWTPFAERIAAFLCRDGGAHFVFQQAQPSQRPAAVSESP